MSGNFEVSFRFAIRARQHDIHHAQSRSSGEETLHGRRHDFGFGLSGFVAFEHCPEALFDDGHAVAEARQLFLRFHGSCHIELDIEPHQLIRLSGRKCLIIAHGHDEFHSIHADAFPSLGFRAFPQPLSGNVRPNLLLHLRFCLVSDPSRLARKNENRFAVEGNQDVSIAVHDLKIGNVANRAFETGVLASANDQRINILVSVSPLQFAG
ncbi:MAG: hypothetical protein DMG18_00340 [Acidobacteria bacterium]|nr:MAG: hypothetical protein DMG18_00340 [Acidobacteriota bacterium]